MLQLKKIIKTTIREYLNEQVGTKFDFKSWFGNSKVVDNNGNPLLVYHGGPKFDTFNQPNKGDKGLYFTDNYYFALYFAMQHEMVERDKRNEWDDIPDNVLKKWDIEGEINEKYLKYSEVKKAYLMMENPIIRDGMDAKLIPTLYDNEHDGVIVKSTGDFGYSGGQYVVFSNEQIWLKK